MYILYVTVLSLMLYHTAQSAAIICYNCTSYWGNLGKADLTGCDYEDFNKDSDSVNDHTCGGSCFAYIQRTSEGDYVQRGCTDICEERSEDESLSQIYNLCCTENYCNGASLEIPSSAATRLSGHWLITVAMATGYWLLIRLVC